MIDMALLNDSSIRREPERTVGKDVGCEDISGPCGHRTTWGINRRTRVVAPADQRNSQDNVHLFGGTVSSPFDFSDFFMNPRGTSNHMTS